MIEKHHKQQTYLALRRNIRGSGPMAGVYTTPQIAPNGGEACRRSWVPRPPFQARLDCHRAKDMPPHSHHFPAISQYQSATNAVIECHC